MRGRFGGHAEESNLSYADYNSGALPLSYAGRISRISSMQQQQCGYAASFAAFFLARFASFISFKWRKP